MAQIYGIWGGIWGVLGGIWGILDGKIGGFGTVEFFLVFFLVLVLGFG
jgi:hypothetical protein